MTNNSYQRRQQGSAGRPQHSTSSQASTPTQKSVSLARLHQRTGAQHAFGGYEKVRTQAGNFFQKRTR